MRMQKEGLSTARRERGVGEGEVVVGMSWKAGEGKSMLIGQKALAGPSVGIGIDGGRNTAEIRREKFELKDSETRMGCGRGD